jgi:A/G-specific adenine glycosylase
VKIDPDIHAFRRLIYDHYIEHGRVMSWRLTDDPYRVLVSEVMLQQTQVERVHGKYELFVERFPDFPSLAAAPLDAVLTAWQGLGYNRRALFLKQAAVRVTDEHQGVLPRSVDALTALPGIGTATACAIVTYAFNTPAPFIETNVRTVFIHFFFNGREEVSDREIMPLVEAALDRRDPRNWYYALMDYGAMLKRQGEKGHRRSAGYRKQSPFGGSDRQVRGRILRLLVNGNALSEDALTRSVDAPEERIRKNVADLYREGFLRESEEGYTIA